MFSKKNLFYLLGLFALANIVNIAFLVLKVAGVMSLRAFIIFDYLLIPILIVIRVPRPMIWLYFCFIFSLDLLEVFSFIYLFSVLEFLLNMKYYSLFSFSYGHYLIGIIFILFVVLIFYFLNLLTYQNGKSRKLIIFSFVAFFVFVYAVDTLNGKSHLNDRKIIPITGYNIGTSVLRDLYILVKDMNWQASIPQPLKSKSVTFETFAADTIGNQLLILVESWGLPRDKDQWDMLQSLINQRIDTGQWEVKYGQTAFKGSTYNAELRELLSVMGDYRFFMNKKNAATVNSIFRLKRNQGYTTLGIHSFSEKMFERSIWWKNIGIDSAYFMDDVIKAKNLKYQDLDHSTPFLSVDDEDAFEFISKKADGKVFTYFLTENSHLPFYPDKSYQVLKADGHFAQTLSQEGVDQLSEVLTTIYFILGHSGILSYEKILIMGDHMPPFSTTADRDFYSSEKVPYFILSKGK